MHDVADFLSRHPPFDDLEEDSLAEVANAAEIEYFEAGTTIFSQGDEPVRHVRVIRRGAVELLDRGRVLDLLGEGQMFGHPSMLSGLPTGFEARAGEDTLCYRFPAEAVVGPLSRPAGLRYVARSLLARPRPDPGASAWAVDPARRPAGALVRGEPLVAGPTDTVRDVARRMAGAGADAALIKLGDGKYGIVTDHDLRGRVVARGVSVDAPVSEVMSAPAFTVGPEQLTGEVMLEMLDLGVRHVAVISPFGDALGVLRDADLMETETQTPFSLRRAIDDAADPSQLRRAAARLRPAVIALHEARVTPEQIGPIIAVVVDALTRRLIEFEVAERGSPPAPFAWIALGSLGRREVVPSSDVDSALVWGGDPDDPEMREYAAGISDRVLGELASLGFVPDAHGATPTEYLGRSAVSWREGIRHAIENPTEGAALILLSMLVDGRVVHRVGDAPDLLDELRQLRHRPTLVRLMLRLALTQKCPTGFLREFVVEGSGEHRGQLDIKRGGLLPVVDLGRYASLATGARVTSTPERLEIASTAGILGAGDARALTEAHDLFSHLRLEHQVEQIRRGDDPDNFLDPESLNPLTRRYLRDAFHAVRSVQRTLENRLRFE